MYCELRYLKTSFACRVNNIFQNVTKYDAYQRKEQNVAKKSVLFCKSQLLFGSMSRRRPGILAALSGVGDFLLCPCMASLLHSLGMVTLCDFNIYQTNKVG